MADNNVLNLLAAGLIGMSGGSVPDAFRLKAQLDEARKQEAEKTQRRNLLANIARQTMPSAFGMPGPDAPPDAARNMLLPVLAQDNPELVLNNLLNPKQAQRPTAKDANGRLRYLDTGELAFPGVEVAPSAKAPTTRSRIAGDKTIVEQFNTTTGNWDFVSEGPRLGRTPQDPEYSGPLTKKGQQDVEKSAIQTGDQMTRLEAIRSSFRPQFQQVLPRMMAAWTSFKDRTGIPVSPQDRAALAQFTAFKRRATDNMNLYIRDITGAQLSEHEAERLSKAVPVPGNGIFDGDGPTQFEAKMDDVMKTLRLAAQRQQYLLQNGLTFDAVPLDDFRSQMQRDAQEAIQRGADPEKVHQRLREMGAE